MNVYGTVHLPHEIRILQCSVCNGGNYLKMKRILCPQNLGAFFNKALMFRAAIPYLGLRCFG